MLRKFYRRVQFPGDLWRLQSELLVDGRQTFNFKAFLDANYQRSETLIAGFILNSLVLTKATTIDVSG